MSLLIHVVPCGGGFVARGKGVAGLFGCIQCDAFMRVQPDKAGAIHLYCDGAVGESKCGLQIKNVAGALPRSTLTDLHRFADDIRAMSPDVRAALARSWAVTIDQLEAFAYGAPNEPEPAPEPLAIDDRGDPAAEPVRPAIPAGSPGRTDPGNSGKPAGNSDEPGPGSGGPGPGQRVERGRPWTAKFFSG